MQNKRAVMSLPDTRTGGRALTLAAILAVFALIATSPICPATGNEAQQMLIDAQALADTGEAEQAKALYQQLIREYPDTVYAGHAYLGLAKVHVGLRENEEALAALDQILENFSRPALVGAAAVQKVPALIHRFSMYDEAIQLAEEQLQALGEYMQPFDRRVMVVQLTYAYDKAGQTEKALATYEEFLPSTPALLTLTLCFERLFELQTKLGKHDEALTTARVG